MNRKTECEARDIFVRFRDMMLYILVRWKSILVVALVVALAAAGIKFWQDTNRYNAIEKAQAQEQAEEEAIPEPLDADGLAHVALVQRYQWNYESLCAYNTTAPMMQIDFQAVPTQRMSYLITGTQSFAAATLYRECLGDEMLYRALSEQFSTKEKPVEALHLMELVTAELEQDTTQNGNSVFVHVKVMAPKQELCESLAQVVREAATSVNALTQQQVGSVRGRWVFDRYGVVRSDAVRDLQLERLTQQEKARDDLKKATDSLTAAEEDYLFMSDREEKETPTWTYPAPVLSVLTLVLGLVGGMVAAALWYALRYLYCGRVLSAAEMEVRHGLAVFGTLAGTKQRFCVDRWLRNCLQEETEEPFLLWHRIALTAKKAGVNAVYVAGDAARLEGLAEVMEQQGVSLQIGSSPLANPETLAALAAADALVVTADLELTHHKTVAAELELAQQLGCQVLGAVLVKE